MWKNNKNFILVSLAILIVIGGMITLVYVTKNNNNSSPTNDCRIEQDSTRQDSIESKCDTSYKDMHK